MLRDFDTKIYHRLLTIPGGKPVRYAAGQVICFQGGEANALVVVSGADIKVQYVSASGRKYTLGQEENYFGVLGEMELFSGSGTHMLSVTAVNPVVGYQLTREKILGALTKMPDLALDFLALMSNRYHTTVTRAMENILYGLRFNALKRLVDLSEVAGHEQFLIAQDIEAESLGTSSRAYRRILKSLLDEGVLEKSGNGYRFINLDRVFSEIQI